MIYAIPNHTHCQVAPKARPINQNLSKSMVLPAHEQTENVYQIERKMTENKEHQAVTAYIIKCGFSADNQHYHPHQPWCFSTGKYHAIRT